MYVLVTHYCKCGNVINVIDTTTGIKTIDILKGTLQKCPICKGTMGCKVEEIKNNFWSIKNLLDSDTAISVLLLNHECIDLFSSNINIKLDALMRTGFSGNLSITIQDKDIAMLNVNTIDSSYCFLIPEGKRKEVKVRPAPGLIDVELRPRLTPVNVFMDTNTVAIPNDIPHTTRAQEERR